MSRKNQIDLGISLPTPDFGFGATGGLALVQEDASLTADRQGIQHESARHLAASKALSTKSQVAEDLMADIEQHAMAKFVETAKVISDCRLQARGADYQPSVDEFARLLTATSAQQMLGCVKVGGAAIAREMARQPYPPPEPEPEPDRTADQLSWVGRQLLLKKAAR